MVYRKERLDVEVIRARGLVGKQGNKNTPGEQRCPLVTTIPQNKKQGILGGVALALYV